MALKIWHLPLILFLIMAISGEVSGKNLLIGGIGQSESDQKNLQEYAEKIDAINVPTYLGDAILVGVPAVAAATPKYEYTKDPNTGEIEVLDSYLSYDYDQKKDVNGLGNDLLNEKSYDTIYAHSGGTRTAVTAMLRQGVTAVKLVLISPIMGHRNEQEAYIWELQQLLKTKKVGSIVVYQSPVDNIQSGKIYQAKFDPNNPGIEGNFKVITLEKSDLKGKSGEAAHKEMWYKALNDELGSSPTPGDTFFSNTARNFDNMVRNFGNLFKPQLSPTSDTSGFSVQNKYGTDVPETSGVSYFDQANDVWYIDAYEWHYSDRSLFDKPAAPRRFVSGELNTIGYNWVSLPYSRTGMTHDQDYFNWCAETLASMGQSAPTAGYGLLIDEGQNGGGGW
jgi:hypothetical protein